MEEGEKLKASFSRYLRVSPDSTVLLSWGPTVSSFHEPENFGYLVFEKRVLFKKYEGSVDWTDDETEAISNLKKLPGADYYKTVSNYLDRISKHTHRNRSPEYLFSRVLEFAGEFPDSVETVDIALRTIHNAGVRGRVSPEVLESFYEEVLARIKPGGIRRDLFTLARGLYYLGLKEADKWEEVYSEIVRRKSPLAATASYFILTRGMENESIMKSALQNFTDQVIKGGAPLYLEKKMRFLDVEPSREHIHYHFYRALHEALRIIPPEVMEVTRSLSTDPGTGDDHAIVMKKIRFELSSDRESPYYSPELAESLIVDLLQLDEKYANDSLDRLLWEKKTKLEWYYSYIAGDSIPEIVEKATFLRGYYNKPDPIDRILSCYYESADSLIRAISYLESHLETTEQQKRSGENDARYLEELTFRPSYSYPCHDCGRNEITLFTPWNRRTVIFTGNDLKDQH